MQMQNNAILIVIGNQSFGLLDKEPMQVLGLGREPSNKIWRLLLVLGGVAGSPEQSRFLSGFALLPDSFVADVK